MVIRKAYKFRLKTTPDINAKMVQYAGNCRFLWNKALAINLLSYRINKKFATTKSWISFPNFGKKARSMAF
ncbi:helix-turn-helix domain-containing protein [Pseudoalteromonas sp. HL-AS2]|uniref:helix-turn-helix domain-containing protein n=1 Tax=Pseudoalteromonas sp. HL-AS2 TaxID=3071082 RepID=UPI0035C195F1